MDNKLGVKQIPAFDEKHFSKNAFVIIKAIRSNKTFAVTSYPDGAIREFRGIIRKNSDSNFEISTTGVVFTRMVDGSTTESEGKNFVFYLEDYLSGAITIEILKEPAEIVTQETAE